MSVDGEVRVEAFSRTYSAYLTARGQSLPQAVPHASGYAEADGLFSFSPIGDDRPIGYLSNCTCDPRIGHLRVMGCHARSAFKTRPGGRPGRGHGLNLSP